MACQRIFNTTNDHLVHRRNYNDVIIMSAMASQITSVSIACSIVCSRGGGGGGGVNQRKGPVTRKMFTFNDVIMHLRYQASMIVSGADDYVRDTLVRSHRKTKLHRMTRWRHDMESLSALLAICEGNSEVTGGFPHKMVSLLLVWIAVR